MSSGRRRRKGRDVTGILLLDKPPGLTSNAALQEVKKLYRAAKAGHTGSLDPIATGLLPVCLGESTKLSGFLLGADKGYEATLKLGVNTRTGDSEGEVVRTRPVHFTQDRLQEVMRSFTGPIKQIPPMFSAIKKDGKPLYELARQGIEVNREPRAVTVHALTCVLTADDVLNIHLKCSSGFYVRSLAEDIGEYLGCGAHVTALRRDVVGDFNLSQAVGLGTLKALSGDLQGMDSLLIEPGNALPHLPAVSLSSDAAYYLCRGQAVRGSHLPAAGLVRLYAEEAGFIGLGKVLDDGRVAPSKLFTSDN